MKKFFTLLLILVSIPITSAAIAQDDEVTLTFATWGNTGEMAGFEAIIAGYEEANPNVTIELLERPGTGYREQMMTELAAGEAPDIIRGGFRGDVAFYAQAGGVIDLTPYLEDDFSADFFEGAWAIVNWEGSPYGLPLHTDTHAVFYNKQYFEELGIDVPQTMDECWSWEEFDEVSYRVKEETDADYGHTVIWNGKRWLMFLYGNGGQLLTDDFSAPAINSPEGIETIAWTKAWYDDGLAPLSTSMKASIEPELLFANGAAGMLITGNWYLPWLKENVVYDWGVTYLPCSVAQDADLGGTALAVSKDSEHPELAADFVKFATNTENMQNFSEVALLVPVRFSAIEDLEYPEFTEEMNLFAEVATTVNSHRATVQGMANFPEMDQILYDELDLAFTSGQSAEETAQNIEEKIAAVLED